MVMVEKRSCHIKEMSHLSFNYSILLWSIYARRFMDYPLLLGKLMQVIVEIISCIISPKFLDRGAKLSGYHFAKIRQESPNCSLIF